MALALTSSAFTDNGPIPKLYTCQGKDISPALAWSGLPAGTKSLALIVDDPDAPDPAAPKMTWVHWVLYNIPVSAKGLEEAVAPGCAARRHARGSDRLQAHGLRWPLPADRPASLLPQALCARCRVAGPQDPDQARARKGDEGPCARKGRADGHLPKVRFFGASIQWRVIFALASSLLWLAIVELNQFLSEGARPISILWNGCRVCGTWCLFPICRTSGACIC